MTVNSSESRVEYNCNGSVTAFTFAFRIFTASDLKVYTSDSSGDTLLELGTHYTVTGLDGGTVNTLTAYPSGTKIIIIRILPLTSEFDPEESGAIPSEALEASVDRLVMIAQQLAAQSGRGLALPITEQSSMELPGVGTRANKFLFFGTDGSVSVKGLAEIGALTADDSTIIMLDNILSLKDGGITTAKLSQEVIDLIDAAAANAVDIHEQAIDPHTQYLLENDLPDILAGTFQYGCEISNNAIDPDYDIDISPGIIYDADNTTSMYLSSVLTKRLDADYAPGNNNGGRPSGVSLSPGETYHVFMIYNPTTDTDEGGFDTDINATALLSHANSLVPGYMKYERLGSVLTDSNSKIIGFIKRKNAFYLKAPIQDVSGSISSTAALQALSIPSGVNTTAIISAYVDCNENGVDTFGLYTSPDQDDVAPSVSAFHLHGRLSVGDYESFGNCNVLVPANTSGQIRVRYSNSNGTQSIVTHGWIDTSLRR